MYLKLSNIISVKIKVTQSDTEETQRDTEKSGRGEI
jgi:hypothetical protein